MAALSQDQAAWQITANVSPPLSLAYSTKCARSSSIASAGMVNVWLIVLLLLLLCGQMGGGLLNPWWLMAMTGHQRSSHSEHLPLHYILPVLEQPPRRWQLHA